MYRVAGASQAAALGAVAVLVRSITPLAVQLPHTGTTDVRREAAEDSGGGDLARGCDDAGAAAERRRASEGSPADAGAHGGRTQMAANVMGEIAGSEHPEQVVVLGGHIDSWDVGQGAQDDGSGIMATLAAVRDQEARDCSRSGRFGSCSGSMRRTAGAGGEAYAQGVGDEELKNHVAAIEMDGGAETPLGYGYGAAAGGGGSAGDAGAGGSAGGRSYRREEQHSLALLQDIGTLLEPVGAGTIKAGGGGCGYLAADGGRRSGTWGGRRRRRTTSTGTTPRRTRWTRSTRRSSGRTWPRSR